MVTLAGSAVIDPQEKLYKSFNTDDIVLNYVLSMMPIRDRATFTGCCKKYHISPSLAAAQAWHESRFRGYLLSPRNTNGSFDKGLFQLNSYEEDRFRRAYWTEERFDPYDTKDNMTMAMKHLNDLLKENQNNHLLSLRLYNAGPRALNPKSTIGLDYAKKILEIEISIIDAAKLDALGYR